MSTGDAKIYVVLRCLRTPSFVLNITLGLRKCGPEDMRRCEAGEVENGGGGREMHEERKRGRCARGR